MRVTLGLYLLSFVAQITKFSLEVDGFQLSQLGFRLGQRVGFRRKFKVSSKRNFGEETSYEVGYDIDVEEFEAWYNRKTLELKEYVQQTKDWRLCIFQRSYKRNLMPVENDFIKGAGKHGLAVEVMVRILSW